MKDGYIKVAAGRVDVSVAHPEYNKEQIVARIREAHEQRVNLLVLPELCVTGYTCADLFFSNTLLLSARQAAEDIVRATASLYPVVVFGVPLVYEGKLYNCAAVAANGKLLGVVPKVHLSGYGEFCEPRHFASGAEIDAGKCAMPWGEYKVPFGRGLLFRHAQLADYTFGVEICQDLWACASPAQELCAAGATVIANPAASSELVGKASERRLLVRAASSRLKCGYVMANASVSESTQDVVFSAHQLIAQQGKLLIEALPFAEQTLVSCELDMAHLAYERRCDNTFGGVKPSAVVCFEQAVCTHTLTDVAKNPFLPARAEECEERAQTILNIQSQALARRLAHTKTKAVIGISGGLDSTLALLVAVRAMRLLGRPNTDIVAVTMPCFGTTERTKSNAVLLCEKLGVTLREVNISASVEQHFADIGHDPTQYDVTYENAQARERTQVLMDISNQVGGIVIGTGDLSELALGWATYNGDHMSMYGVNADVPKTVVRYLVRYEATHDESGLSRVLWDILDTPVSPELLPADDQGKIAQRTEDLVGPYELHDFFLYYVVRYGDTPDKIFRLARTAFAGEYEDAVILHWLSVFHRRFFAQQFKRSCLPDGPAVGSVSLSPRGDWRMPTDADSALWMRRIEALRATVS